MLLAPSLARADWRELRCYDPGSSELLVVQKEPAGRFRVATQNTQMFLLGLSCEVPHADEPLFRCTGSAGNSTFKSALVIERGWTKDDYGYAECESFVVSLRYLYEDGQGQTQLAERDWKFARASCTWK